MSTRLLATSVALLLLAVTAVGSRPVQGQEQTYRVIVHPGVSADGVTAGELSDLFLKKADRWPDGSRVFPVDQVETAAVREAFTRDVHGRSVSAIKSYWQQRIFSGRDVPPPEKPSDREVVDFVRSTPGAVGYVSAGTALQGVATLGLER